MYLLLHTDYSDDILGTVIGLLVSQIVDPC